MLLQGSISEGKTQKLIDCYADLLNSGIDSSKILVIVQNSTKKEQFINKTLNQLTIDSLEKLQIYSFFGLVYNTISDNWAVIENLIPDRNNTKILPNLTGLEVSQYIMKEIISDIKFEGYNSKKSLLHQLFRRYSLIVQNNLSDKDVQWRSDIVLKESFAPDAKMALDEFKKRTLESRGLDYLRQSLIFNYIYKSTDYFSNIEYLIIDDADEITPICFDFIAYLKPQLKDTFIGYDPLGASRSGYLSADKSIGVKLEELFEDKPLTPTLSPKGRGSTNAKRFYSEKTLNQAIQLRKDQTEPEHILWFLLRDRQFCDLKFRRQAPLGKYIVDFICLEKKLIIELDGSGHLQEKQIKHDTEREIFMQKEGYKILRFYNSDLNDIQNVLEKIYQEISPSPLGGEGWGEGLEKAPNALLNDSQIIFDNVINQKSTKLKNFSLLSVSKRAQMLDLGIKNLKKLIKNGVKPSEITIVTPIIDDMFKFCLKEALNESIIPLFLSGSEKIVQNPIVQASLNILKFCDKDSKSDLSEFEIRSILNFLGIPVKHCKEILKNFEQHKIFIDFEFKLEEYTQKYRAFLEVINNLEAIEKLSEQVYEIYDNLVEVENFSAAELTKFNFFIKQIEDFESVLNTVKNSDILVQIENSIISENPYSTLEIRENELAIATPQKVIDNLIQTKYQFWFDVSSDEWIKSDTGPLYNAWVFQAGWDKPEFTLQDNIELSRQKTARILRKLTLCASEWVFAYASLFDGSGVENFGGIEKYLSHETDSKKIVSDKKFIPREDQKPILDYKNKKMAISAVPGAGKTTILLELIIKLLENGAAPENIFVLTYMESAARNFRERIQNANQELSQLPNISTIHGLALKILKENSNFERLALNADFEICDDTQRSRILRELSQKFEIKKTELEDFDRAVSILKIGGGEGLGERVSKPDKKLSKFLEFFDEYKKVLQENNLIDYDDMLLMSVRLLEENPDVLAYYQDLCHFIIEDEAQDSSAIQQRLIELLSSKHKNLIRCGDINQAITTTFSNADVEGFRDFIETSELKVSMDRSQRCIKDVWSLANDLVIYAQNQPETKNAFYKIFMKPVEGRNPEQDKSLGGKPLNALILENEFSEKNYILKQIKELLSKSPKATVGILLRSNFQVGRWTNFINNAGLKTITRSECLEQKGVFRTIFAWMKIIENPFNNENVAINYETLAELGHCKSNLFMAIKEAKEPFAQMDVDKMNNIGFESFYWDVIYWLSFSTLSPEELAIKIGLHYYSSEVEKSNVYLISTLIKRLSLTYPKYSTLMERLSELSKKPNLSGFKFFSEEEKSDKEILEGKVQIMTLHKSKGDEFDFVFLPEMTEASLPLGFENVKLKKNARFMESVRELNPNYPQKTDEELREFLLAENLRLMYVAITRAKQKLFITSNKSTKYNKEPQANLIFEIING